MASTSKIEDIIDEMEALIEECKPVPFSKTSISVNRDDIEFLISELRSKIPDEIRRYQKMLSQKEAILADAEQQRQQIIAQAQITTNELVSEHQIMTQAYAKANEFMLLTQKKAQEIMDASAYEANSMKEAAVTYTDQLLSSVQAVLVNSIDTARTRNTQFIDTLQGYLDIVEANRAVLNPSDPVVASQPVVKPQTVERTAEPAKPTISEPPATEASDIVSDDAISKQMEEVEQVVSAEPDDDLPALDIPDTFFNKE